jgi:hypothetical protein
MKTTKFIWKSWPSKEIKFNNGMSSSIVQGFYIPVDLTKYAIEISPEEFHKKYHPELSKEECFRLYYPIRVTDICAKESKK